MCWPAPQARPGVRARRHAFFEPADAAIRRFDNLSASQPATFIACYLVTVTSH